jgi:hypothetical protein
LGAVAFSPREGNAMTKKAKTNLRDLVTPASTALAEQSAKRVASVPVAELNKHVKLCNAPSMISISSTTSIYRPKASQSTSLHLSFE